MYDTTMQFEGYHGEICDDQYTRKQDLDFPTVFGTFWSKKPIHCHIHVNVVAVRDIVSAEDALEDVNQKVERWLDESWMRKETEMEHFINNQSFSTDWNEQHVWVDE